MVKAYLRYKLSQNIGLIYSSGTGLVYLPNNPNLRLPGKDIQAANSSAAHQSRQLVAVGALEQVLIWDLKRGECVAALPPRSPVDSDSQDHMSTIQIDGQVTSICVINTSSEADISIAVGYSDGYIRLWNLHSLQCTVAFNGHRKAVTCLSINEDGSHIVSGSNDCHVIVWDIVGEQGLYRLRGHTDSITQVVYLSRHNTVISSSKDGFVKIWDLPTQHCVQTLTGHRKEVWAMAVNPEQTRLITGSVDQLLRVWKLTNEPPEHLPEPGADEQHSKKRERSAESGDDVHLGQIRAELLGQLNRQTNGRLQSLSFSSSYQFGSGILCCQTADKSVELFRVHDPSDVIKRARKRRTKTRQKLAKRESTSTDPVAEPPTYQPSDEYSTCYIIRSAYKVCGAVFSPTQPHITLGLVNNRLETYKLDNAGDAEKISAISLPGHRSGIRAVAIAHDDSLIASTSKELKVWSTRSTECVRSIKLEEAEGVTVAFLPGNRHVVLGSKEGHLSIYEISTGERSYHNASAHQSAVWSIHIHPNQKGMVTGSADHTLKFWDFVLDVNEAGNKTVGLTLAQSISMAEDVMAVAVTDKFVAVALLDHTIKIFHEDTMKFFLSLYGHKLPVLSHDISDDNALLVSGSADKNIKIWGMDFGDCHKSIFAHDGSVMQVKFVKKTHYFFSAGKDFLIKQWNADTFEHIMTLKGHWGEIWGLAVSRTGEFVVSSSQDRSLRVWTRTDEQLFLEEEREKEMDNLFESTLAGQRTGHELDQELLESSTPGKRTLETIKCGEQLIEAITIAQSELNLWNDYQTALELAAERMPLAERPEDPDAPLLAPPDANPQLQGKSPSDYVLDALVAIPSPFLEEALLMLPFSAVIHLFHHLNSNITRNYQTELMMRCTLYLLKMHHAQIITTPILATTIRELQTSVRLVLQRQKDQIGYNLAALKYTENFIKDRSSVAYRALTSIKAPDSSSSDKKSTGSKKNRRN